MFTPVLPEPDFGNYNIKWYGVELLFKKDFFRYNTPITILKKQSNYELIYTAGPGGVF
jgi:hypothetical protein